MFGAAGGWIAAAAPVHGSANAGGATPIATHTTVADASDSEAIRRRGDMSHLSWHDVALTSELTDVTIVITEVDVISDARMGTVP